MKLFLISLVKQLNIMSRGTNDFKVGADIFKGSGALRYMDNPPQDGRSIDNAANYNSSLDVHFSAVFITKLSTFLATKSGWNTRKAFEVFADANRLYWTANSTFVKVPVVLKAAANRNYTVADVTAAFSAVGVTGGCGTTPPPGGGALTKDVAVTFSAATGQSATYTFAVPSGATNLSFKMSEVQATVISTPSGLRTNDNFLPSEIRWFY